MRFDVVIDTLRNRHEAPRFNAQRGALADHTRPDAVAGDLDYVLDVSDVHCSSN